MVTDAPDLPPVPADAAPRRPAPPRRGAARLLSRLPKGTVVLTAFTGLSVVLGYVREGVIAYYFGTSSDLDTFLVAFTIPKLLVALATTVTVSALLPVYVGYLRGGEPERATDLVQRWLALLLAVLAVVALVLSVAPGLAISLLAPGFDAAQTAGAGRLLRGLLPYTVLGAAAAAYKVVLDSHQRFTAPAAARALVTVVVIALVVLASAWLGIWALVVGYGIGGVVMFGLHAAGARGIGEAPRLLRLRLPRLALLPLAAVGWVALQMMLGQVFSVADRIFASALDAGSIAALNYAMAIVTAPQNLVTAVLATALFPILARKVSAGRPKAALREAGKWVAVVWLCAAPLILLMIVFRTEIVALLLQRGAFRRASTDLVASILLVTPWLIAIGGSSAILNRLLLARKNYRFTAALAGIGGAAKVGLNALLVGPMGVTGLALASVLAGTLGLVLRIAYLWRYGSSAGAGPPRPAPATTP